MDPIISDHERSVIEYYKDRTDEFYLRRWDSEDIHFGIFDHDESPDIERYAAGDHDVLRRGIRRMTELITAPAQIRSTDVVVDAGCGVGGTAIYLAKKYGCRVLGINISQHQIDIARAKARKENLNHLVEFEYGDCSKLLPVRDNYANVIVNIESACHYSNREFFIEECARILTNDGRIVAQDLIAKEEIDQNKTISATCKAWAMHFPLESRISYQLLLEKYGFTICEMNEIEGFMPTIDLMHQSATHFREALKAGARLTDNELLWLQQFETMANASYARHLTLLQYSAALSPVR